MPLNIPTIDHSISFTNIIPLEEDLIFLGIIHLNHTIE